MPAEQFYRLSCLHRIVPPRVLSVLGLALALVAHGATQPNIIFFLVDDLGSADVGFRGGKEIKTPHIDRIAASGVVLDQFYVQPVCSPTRAAFLTGRYPIRYGLQTGVIRPRFAYGLSLEERLLPQALREAGYTTAICGKWHLGHMSPEYLPTRRGFDHQYGHYNGALDYFAHTRDGGFDWHRDDKVSRDEGYSTELIARECVRLIEAQPANKPLFLYVPFTGVHAPYQVPERYLAAYPKLKGLRRKYAGMLSAVDEAIGQIMSAMDRKGWREQTLVIFSTDNGGPKPGSITDNAPFRAGKGTLYEGGVRSCAAMAWPGKIKAGTVVRSPMHMVDLYPTLIQLAGASAKQKLPLDGRDLWPVLTGRASSVRDEVLINAEPRRGAIRVGDWKLVLNGGRVESEEGDADTTPPRELENQFESVELFNLANDPAEKKDVAGKKRKKVMELRARYEALAKQAVAPLAVTVKARLDIPAVWGESGNKVK
jgi:arylsulfatase A-like enzyme